MRIVTEKISARTGILLGFVRFLLMKSFLSIKKIIFIIMQFFESNQYPYM